MACWIKSAGRANVITIYHLSTSRSERIVWLAEELGIEYKLEVFPREPNGAAPPPIKALHAIGKAPVIRDGDAVLAESGAIVEYIVQRHGGGRLAVRPEAPDYARYVYWMHFAEGSLMSLMLIALVLSRVPEAKESPVRTRILDRMKQMLAFVDAEIGDREYFARAFTAADVMMLFPFTTMRKFLDYDLAPYANIVA
jgi:glutathione S-transferase